MLTPRLKAVADFVPLNVRLADIGTDHANLPIFLMNLHKITAAIAVDVREGPFSTAQSAVTQHNLTRQIEVRLGSGLSVIHPNEVDIAVFAGMGGTLITNLLKASSATVASLHGLILQPQLAAEKLRRYIYEIGWHIEAETLAKEQHHIYQIIYAIPGRREMPDRVSLEIGPMLLRERPPLFSLHLDVLLHRNKKIAAELANSQLPKNKLARRNLLTLINDLELNKYDKMPGYNGCNGKNSSSHIS
ncbi:tRNA (adenine(22)-N(1))-methyltransferase [Pectinatus frisingensis]|jgi:tRNA (adenine22-N1)-methyltransferase|uniref:tRNA (adenine(22)-N(1))-methyltransferase n=1 Tax=Pectinatus frisingensis TaxID=865 RepID=UPI0015F6C70B|nr:class I SAM-dependent methyltransferase [Pectinatus frisingensis]